MVGCFSLVENGGTYSCQPPAPSALPTTAAASATLSRTTNDDVWGKP